MPSKKQKANKIEIEAALLSKEKGPKEKKRADQWLVERGLVETREKAKALIMAGQVLTGTRRVEKPGDMLNVTLAAALTLKAGLPYVSRGGLKLERALDEFGLSPAGKLALDIGASTGGFTDCLLQRGAKAVYAVDVGQSQLAWSLQTDPRVIMLDKTNIRYLEALPPLEPGGSAPLAELVVIDVSFISLRLVLPAAGRLITSDAPLVVLVKPQFEAGRELVGKGGIIRDPAVHRKVLEDLVKWCDQNQILVEALIRSPILGTEGNVEFLAYLRVLKHTNNLQEQLERLSLIGPLFETGKLPAEGCNGAIHFKEF
ncbi:MAG: TlyA family RNA methyltransferase [Chloroflexi bacterium]|nr:TlyA family RNA methyltransferase [Chloroflexota bacterium]